MTAGKAFVFRFEDVEVRERELTLIKAGEVLPVEPKAFRVLLFLLHNPQKLITKEELLDAVWADAAVTESSLTRSIAKLRRALRDDFQEPRYIATVATVGYRFVCPVQVSDDGYGGDLALVGAETIDIVIQAKPRSIRRWWLFAAAVFAIGLAALVWYLRRPLPPPRITRYDQITHDGHNKWPAGTDGGRVYFLQATPYTIAQVGIKGGEVAPVPVAVPEVADLDDVSPDGSNLLIESYGEGSKLWDVRIPGALRYPLGDDRDAAFSPDGLLVCYSTQEGGIYLVRNNGTESHKIFSMRGHTQGIAWSPDGKFIRFFKDDQLWEISSDGSNPRQLLDGWHASSSKCCGRYTPDGSLYLFLSQGSAGEGEQIWALDERRGLFRRPPTEPLQLTSGPLHWRAPIPGKDGKSIFAASSTHRGELSRLDVQTKQFQPFLGGISAEGVTFSKDGHSVAYVSFPERILWKADRDGSNPVQLSDRPIKPFMPRWSPDGTQILFSTWGGDPASPSEAYIVSARGGAPRKLLPEGTGVQSDPDWSPDGHKIVFGNSWGGFDPKSVIRIFYLDSRQITTLPESEGKTDPRWSPDGRSIAANSFDLATMNIFDVATRRWSALPPKIGMAFPEWSRDSQFIYFIHLPHDPGVYRMRVKGRELENVVDLKDWPLLEGWGWMGLDPTDAPLLLRDISSNDIYALTLDQK